MQNVQSMEQYRLVLVSSTFYCILVIILMSEQSKLQKHWTWIHPHDLFIFLPHEN